MTWALWWVGCTSEPIANRWLGQLAAGDDAAAYEGLDVPFAPRGGFDLVRFTKRVDRLDLRALDVTWTDRRRRTLLLTDLEGTAADGREVALRVFGRQIREPKFGDVPLVPDDDYTVIPDDRPVGELVISDLRTRSGAGGLVVGGTVDALGTLTIHGRCLVGERWVANAVVGTISGPFTLTLGVPDGAPCELALSFSEQGRVRRGVVCAGATVAPGPCEPAPVPDPTGPPAVASAIAARWIQGGVTVDYHLRANVAQPVPYSFESASVTTRLTCPGGKRPIVHHRPVDTEWLEPGVDRVLGSPLGVNAEGRPCDLTLDYVRDDHYDRLELPLFVGCVEADGAVRTGPCGG